jgi:hypothetical protein
VFTHQPSILRQNHKNSSAANSIPPSIFLPFIDRLLYPEYFLPRFLEGSILQSQKRARTVRIDNTQPKSFKMRSSTVVAVFGAALVAASPAHRALHARKIVTDIVTETICITVTEGQIPTPALVETVVVSSTVYVHPYEATPSHSSAPPPPPPPPPPPTTSTTTTTSLPAPISTPEYVMLAPPPAPTTTKKAAVVAPAPTVAAPAASPTDYVSAAVDSHNYHRANHSASDISWSDSLAASAKIVADSCVFAHNM